VKRVELRPGPVGQEVDHAGGYRDEDRYRNQDCLPGRRNAQPYQPHQDQRHDRHGQRHAPAEALQGTTTHAARALGLDDRGRITPGLRADLALWDVAEPGELVYALGRNPLKAVWVGGDRVRGKP